MDGKPVIALSSCLIGHEVRYDGGHKNNRYIADVLSRYFDFLPFCPEVATGMGTPRPAIRLIARADGGVDAADSAGSGAIYTDALQAYGRKIAARLDGVVGYIFKKDSPSCGMERVKVHRGEQQPPERTGRGIYAAEIMAAHPSLPVEEEGRLMDPRLRENFIERVFVYARWRRLLEQGLAPRDLVAFHTAHKLALLAHDETVYRVLGRMVADAGKRDMEEMGRLYIRGLMSGLKVLTTPKKHANVLMHIMGYFSHELAGDDKAELLRLIDAHREGLMPVIVPITLINYFRRKYPKPWIDGQTYLEPHPPELMLRNML